MNEMHLKQSKFTYSGWEPFKNLEKQEIQDIFTKMNLILLVFKMIQLMKILKIQQEEQLLIKF